jgi:hypothetical protein
MTTYYVSSEIGSNNNAGTSATAPLASLQAAANLVQPGDTVEVMNGTYTTGGNGDVLDITTSGTASAPITFEAAPGQTPVINSSGSWNAINIEASNIVVSGFTVVGDAANYTLQSALAGYSAGNPSLDGNGISVNTPGNGVVPNHITIENNTVYNEPGGGIGTGGADYVQILNNVVYDNAHWSAFGTSGISINVSANSDTNPGVHDVISGNLVFGNSQLVPTTGTNTITDGEGIILDTNPGFVGEILVENNTVYSNGSSGIESFVTDNAVITGNTVYGNDTQNVMPAMYAQILINQSNNNTVTNNITTAPNTPPPSAPVISGDTVNYGNSVTLNGTAQAGSTITVFDNSTQLGTTVTTTSGAWAYTTGALANGSQSFTATATNSAGNVSSPSAALVTTLNAPVNLVANGNFATGDFTNWTLGGNYNAGQITIDSNAEGGSAYAAGLGSMGSDGTLSQTIATTAGQTYTLSFWLQNEGSGGNDFKAIWNGQTLLSLTNAAQSGYTEYTYTVTATSSTSTLEFSAANNPSQWDLDNISLAATGTSSSPPPSGPAVSSIVESPSSGTLGAGQTVTLTLDMSKNVTVSTASGKPTLTLNDGGTATYKSGSGTSALIFTYTVAAGQNTADLAVTKVNLNGATIQDGTGNAANLSLIGMTQTGPQIDTSAPVTVGAGAKLEIAGTDTGSVTFAASTGMLKLDTPSTFTGKIFNFTGNGTLSGSDQIDLTNINFNTVKDRYANGVLTVTDGTHTDKLNLNGSHTRANFSFASDGSGGTIVYDPPVSMPSSQDTPNATSTGTSGPPSIGTGKTLELTASDPGGAAFTGSAGTLILDGVAPAGHALDFTGPVTGLGGRNVIDLPGIAFDAQTTLGYSANNNQTGGTLSLADGTHSVNIALLGNYMASCFAAESDSHGGTMVVAEASQPSDQSQLSHPHHT